MYAGSFTYHLNEGETPLVALGYVVSIISAVLYLDLTLPVCRWGWTTRILTLAPTESSRYIRPHTVDVDT